MLVANGAGRTDVGSPIGHLRCGRTKSLLCGVRSEMSAHSRRNVEVNWAEVRSEVEDALQRCGLFALPVRIDGTLKPLGAGLNHENFLFRLNTDGRLPHPDETIYVLRRLRRDSADAPYDELVERLRCEARTLQTLASPQLDFAAPQFVCFVGGCKEAPHGFIETALSGLPCEHIVRDQSKGEVLIELIARSAAAVHRLLVDGFCFLTRHADNRDHLLTELDVVSTPFISEESDARACIEWIRGHLPNRRPSVFLHGDLLPQNLLWDFEKGRLSILDWEFAQIGDPAYDLAIVTRGNRKLFGLANGLTKLVDAYRQAGGTEVTKTDVTCHELIMVLRWLGQAIQCEREGLHRGHPPEFYRTQLRAILGRADGRTREK